MRIERRPLAEIPDETLSRLAGDSFFASRGFLELWRATGGHPAVWTAETGGVIGAALPGVEYGFWPASRFASMPDGCYGGVLVDAALERDRAALAGALLEAVTRRHYAWADVFDFHRTVAVPAGFTMRLCRARLVDIADPEWKPPDRKLQSQIRKAIREGLQVERFDWARHGAAFLDLARTTARRHGQRPRYPGAFYRTLARLAERDPRIVWRWCERDGRPACSHIYFIERSVLQAWQSYFDRAFSFVKPNQWIRFEACRDAARHGIRWLNLGSTPEAAGGLAYYKARWGGREASYPSYVRREGLGLVSEVAGTEPLHRRPRWGWSPPGPRLRPRSPPAAPCATRCGGGARSSP